MRRFAPLGLAAQRAWPERISAGRAQPIVRDTLPKDHFKKPWRERSRFSAPEGSRTATPQRAKSPQRDIAKRPSRDDAEGPLRLFGLHAVEAALRNPARRIHRLLLTENAERRLIETLGPITAKIDRVTPRDLDRLLGPDTVHQGVVLETEPLPEPRWDDLARASDGRPLIVLDQVTDPHNVGAILRSSAVFGASGLVMTHRHSPPLNGVLAKSASGALELIPVALVANLARALEELRDAGFALVGLDGGADAAIEDLDWSRPTALVMGSEGKGLRELTRKTCDTLVRISTDGPVASLNVSNAAAIALYAAMRARK